jgi:large subunit ribosomal protein L25
MTIELKAKERKILGKKVKNLRKEGLIPAELFGPEIDNKHLIVTFNEFLKTYKEAGKNTIIELKIDNEKNTVSTLISDVQIHPISRKPLSIDFKMINRNVKIEAEVPIKLIGEAPAEKEGLIVVQVLEQLEIESFPQDIPHELEVDVSNLKTTEDHIYVKDLKTPDNIEVLTSNENAVVIISEKEEEIEGKENTENVTDELGELGSEKKDEPEILNEKDSIKEGE